MLEPFFPSFRVRNRWQGGAPKFGNAIHKACRGVNQSTPTAFPTCCSRTLSSRKGSRKHLFSLLLCLPLFYLLTPVVVFLKNTLVWVWKPVSVAEAGNLLRANRSLFFLSPPCSHPYVLVLYDQKVPSATSSQDIRYHLTGVSHPQVYCLLSHPGESKTRTLQWIWNAEKTLCA